MSQAQIKLTGAKALVVIVAILGFGIFRFTSARSSIETDAADRLHFWLQAEYSRRYMAEHSEVDEAMAKRLLALDRLEFTEISGRGRPDDMVVRVRIAIDGSSPPFGKEVRYFRMEHSMVTGWMLERETWGILYYLNII